MKQNTTRQVVAEKLIKAAELSMQASDLIDDAIKLCSSGLMTRETREHAKDISANALSNSALMVGVSLLFDVKEICKPEHRYLKDLVDKIVILQRMVHEKENKDFNYSYSPWAKYPLNPVNK